MSETVTFNADTASQGGAPAPDGGAEPAATEATAPATNGAATETTTDQRQEPDDDKTQPANRRIRALSARVSGLIAENEALKQAQARAAPQQPQAWPQTAEELERLIDQRAEQKATEREMRAKADAFHEAGHGTYADWAERCTSLQQMGADAHLSQMLVELKDGARVAGELADDPEALQRITAIRTERGRAIALGMYAATLPAPTPAAAPRRQVSRAPAPIRPVTGTANPAPNIYTMPPDQLVEHFSREAMEQQMKMRRGR